MTTGDMRHSRPGSAEVPDEDCAKALEKVFLFLDNEMDEEDCDAIRHHLDACEPCLEKYDLEVMVKSLVARSCGCEPAPEDLRRKVLMRIQQVQTEIGGSSVS